MNALLSTLASLADGSVPPPSWRQDDLVAALLILLLGVVLGIGLICLLVVVHFLKTGRMANRIANQRTDDLFWEKKARVSLFALPCRWLAVRSTQPSAVQAALGLQKATPCSWEEGLNAAHEQKLFISPPIGGWILVMGSNLPDPAEDVDQAFRFILSLSRKLGHVQFFSFNRALHHHAWVRADGGQVQRAYAWAGRTVWNQGPKTRAEIDLRLSCFEYAEPPDSLSFGEIDPAAQNTEQILILASCWSLDPSAVDPRMLRETQGIAGRLSRSNTA